MSLIRATQRQCCVLLQLRFALKPSTSLSCGRATRHRLLSTHLQRLIGKFRAFSRHRSYFDVVTSQSWQAAFSPPFKETSLPDPPQHARLSRFRCHFLLPSNLSFAPLRLDAAVRIVFHVSYVTSVYIFGTCVLVCLCNVEHARAGEACGGVCDCATSSQARPHLALPFRRCAHVHRLPTSSLVNLVFADESLRHIQKINEDVERLRHKGSKNEAGGKVCRLHTQFFINF